MSKKLAITLGLVGVAAVGAFVCSKSKKNKEKETEDTTEVEEEQQEVIDVVEEVVVEDTVTETEDSGVYVSSYKEEIETLENYVRESIIPVIFDILDKSVDISNEVDMDYVDETLQRITLNYVEGKIGTVLYATGLANLLEEINEMPHNEVEETTEESVEEEVEECNEETEDKEEVEESEENGEPEQSE